MPRRIIVAAFVIAFLWLATPFAASSANNFIFQTNMYGANVVPPVNTGAWGFVRFFFNESRTEADYTVDVKGISSSLVEGADMFRGAPGTNGSLVRHLADGGFLTIGGHFRLSASDVADFESGAFYVVLYTTAHPDGEIRGQVYVPSGFIPGTVATGTEPTFAGIPAPVAPPAQQQAAPPPPPPDAAAPALEPPEAPAAEQVATAPAPQTAPRTGPAIRPPDTGDGGLLPSNAGSARAALAGLSAVIIGVGLLFASGFPRRD